MEIEQDQEIYTAPVSPIGQYLSSSVLSLSIIAVLELEIPFDDSQTLTLLKDLFLPINPRFSSIMVVDKNGVKRWKEVEVNLKQHVNVPIFSCGMKPEFYDKCVSDYLTKIASQPFPEARPLWELHLIKYPTSHAASNIIFKLHHSLGDGYSLMGALLSCLKRADNPSLPLTFPRVKLITEGDGKSVSICRRVPKMFSSIYNTASDFISSIRGSLVEDAKSPIRSGNNILQEIQPVTITTLSLSLDQIKQIKAKLGGTINDVLTGTIFLGTRLYMEKEKQGSAKLKATSLVLLNTRMFGGYKSVQDMVKPDAEFPWGNNFAFLSVNIPKLTHPDEAKDPLKFVSKAQKIIKKKRTSFAVFLTARYLQLVKKFKGPEAVSTFLFRTLKNSTMGITNLMGPLEKMSLADHPVKGLYFVVTGAPHTIGVGAISYMGRLRVVLRLEKDFIDADKLKSHVENAFDMILKAACGTPPQTN